VPAPGEPVGNILNHDLIEALLDSARLRREHLGLLEQMCADESLGNRSFL
jgi:hypothetical protein